MRFTTSWDDGHPADLRLAELLCRHGFKGTFYVPLNNDRFGLPVLDARGLRELDTMAELGSHTLDHCYLTTVPDDVAERQISDGLAALQDVLGHAVAGFCYPGGQYAARHVEMVRRAGFAHARTTVNLRFDSVGSPFEQPTTLQLYPHPRSTYLKNWLRRGGWSARTPLLAMAFRDGSIDALLRRALDHALATGGDFHLWGHAWELDACDGWRRLDDFLGWAAGRVPASQRLTNSQMAS